MRGDNDFEVLLNKEDISLSVSAVNDSNSNSTTVILERTGPSTLVVSFSNGVSITATASFGILGFVVTVPQEFQGMSMGLLGNFNSDVTDDMMYPNGTTLELGASDREIHNFGQSCKKLHTYKLRYLIIKQITNHSINGTHRAYYSATTPCPDKSLTYVGLE